MFALVSALLVTGCSSGNNKNKEEQKVIRVATSGTYYPFAFKDKDKLKGFEVDFGMNLLNELIVKLNGY